MPICPYGHASAAADYCDDCGALMTPGSQLGRSKRTEVLTDDLAVPVAEPCPVCGTTRSGTDRFCEGCGFDATSTPSPGPPPPGAPTGVVVWTAMVAADRHHYERLAPELSFPNDREAMTFVLEAAEVTIGRSRPRDETPPDIDLAGPLADPGASHRHAVLHRAADRYQIVDAASTNGTSMNGELTPIEPGKAVDLVDGDRLHIGAWTTITIRAVRGDSSA